MRKHLVCAAFGGLALALCAGAATDCRAADKAKDGKPGLALPSMQLGDFDMKLATDEPHVAGVPDPSGLTTMRQDDSPRAFLGLSLSRPLPDNFWDFTR
jgi:hypothetical protein